MFLKPEMFCQSQISELHQSALILLAFCSKLPGINDTYYYTMANIWIQDPLVI